MEELKVRTSIIRPGESIIKMASSANIGGGLGPLLEGSSFNSYGLCLVKNNGGNYILIIYMKIQFIFQKGSTSWSGIEKTKFISNFKTSINNKWGNLKLIKTLSKNRHVYLDFRFLTSHGKYSIGYHWDIYIKKIPKNSFSTSYVNQYLGITQLDSEDFRAIHKGSIQKQRGAVHEFGHMLKLDDEYLVNSKNNKDLRSIMHSGETIRFRHQKGYIDWLNKTLKEKNIN